MWEAFTGQNTQQTFLESNNTKTLRKFSETDLNPSCFVTADLLDPHGGHHAHHNDLHHVHAAPPPLVHVVIHDAICTQSRHRIIEHTAEHYGVECTGEYAENRYCQSYECRGKNY